MVRKQSKNATKSYKNELKFVQKWLKALNGTNMDCKILYKQNQVFIENGSKIYQKWIQIKSQRKSQKELKSSENKNLTGKKMSKSRQIKVCKIQNHEKSVFLWRFCSEGVVPFSIFLPMMKRFLQKNMA